MAEKDTIFSGRVIQKGIFNFKDFYSFAYDWLIGEGYNVTEKKYEEEISGDSKKVEIKWEAKKKISDYFTFLIKVHWRFLQLKEIEVVKEGKKEKMNSGTAEIKPQAILVKDYEHRWEDQPIWKFLRGIYDRYIIKSRIDEYEDKLKEEIEEFLAQCKSYLSLEGKR